jgi:hypothetical protein
MAHEAYVLGKFILQSAAQNLANPTPSARDQPQANEPCISNNLSILPRYLQIYQRN